MVRPAFFGALLIFAVPCVASASVRQENSPYYRHGMGQVQGRAERAVRRQDTRRQRAKNVILLVADGNGISSNYATRLWMGQQEGGYGDDYVLPHERMPHLALSKTYNTNAQTPDSAGTATALNSGIKTRSGILGLNASARNSRCEDLPGSLVTLSGTL